MTLILELGNAAPLNSDGNSTVGNAITKFEFSVGPQSEQVELLSKNTKYAQRIRNTPENQRDWFIHLLDIEDSWWAAHSNDPPEWVECSEKDLGELVADYFTTDDHECAIGRPKDW